MTAATIAERIRLAMQPRRYSLPPEAQQYARHKSAAGQQEFRWITIGGDHDGDKKHAGGTHVQIKSSTGEIVAGPDALTGKKVGELGKPEAKKTEPKSNEKPARKSGYFKGDRIEYTGKMVDGFHEFEYMEGHKKGETGVTATAPDGSHPRDGKFQEEWKQQQEEFGRLHKKDDPKPADAKSRLDKLEERTGKAAPEVEVRGISQEEMKAKGGHAAILDHLKTGKHTSLSDLRSAIGDSPTLEGDLRSLADDDRISMHKPRAGEPGLWMTPEQVKRHGESPQSPEDTASDAEPEKASDEKPTETVPQSARPSLPDSSEGDPVPANTSEPRKTSAKLFDREYDSEYAFARKSAVPNFGEDVLGSARHKRNAWRGLADAEQNGTAEQQVTRDNLLKNEPHDLMSHAAKNPLTSLAMFHALKLFPPKPPKQSTEDRKQYVEEYQNLKSVVEEQAKSEVDPNKATRAVLLHVRDTIQKLRDKHGGSNALANAMCGMQTPLWKSRGRTIQGKMEEFAKAVQAKYGALPKGATDEARSLMDSISRHAQDIIEGVSLPESFGKESDGKKVRKWSAADRYVGTPKRVGGKNVGDVASSGVKASKHLVDAFKMKAVQWGNSVTDKEREHHGRHAVEAFTDLADVLGLKPEDVSLDGKIALAIGSRGRGGSSATYHPSYQVINLNRSGGVGALAHEWGHAFDHSLEGYGLGADDAHYGSERLPRRNAIRESSVVRDREAFDRLHPPLSEHHQRYAVALSDIDEAMRSSGFNDRLKERLRSYIKDGSMSHEKAFDYWNSTREKFARCFERYVQRKLHKAGRENTYLTGLSDGGDLWPTDAEADALEPHFDKLFAAYRNAKYGSEEPQRFSREELAEFYAKQLGFNWDEQKHPRDAGGLFAKKGEGESGAKSAESRAFNDPIGTRYEPDHAKEMVGQIRDGDAGSKNRGEYSPRLDTGPLVMSEIPTDFFDQYPDEDDGNATNFYKSGASPDRVGKYKTTDAKNLPPIYVHTNSKGRHILSDGAHRLTAAIERGDKTIRALVSPELHEQLSKKQATNPEAKPEPQPPAKAKPPGVAGMQQSLFGQDQQTGQKSLFNVSKPAAKKPAAKEIAAKITGRLGELLAGKATVSPADLTIPIQSESLPGQKSMFSMAGAEQYEKRWITLGKDGAENRTRCQIDDDGRIVKGPAALKGDNISSLGDKSKTAERRVKADHAKAAGKTGRDVTTKQAVSLGLANKVQQHQHAAKHAKLAGVSTADVLKLMPEAQQFLAEQSELRERAKDRARKLTGMNAGTLAQIENSHRDYSTVPGFDKAANAVAMEHPELGLDPDDSDTPAEVWGLIREGKQDPPALHSPEVAKLAADWLKASKAGKKQAKSVGDDDSVPFSMSEADSEKVRLNLQSSVDATREPR